MVKVMASRASSTASASGSPYAAATASATGTAATYDAAAGVVSVRVPKASPGEHFDDLGMLSELLRKPDRSAAPKRGPLIEVMSSTTAEGAEGEDDACDSCAVAFVRQPSEERTVAKA